MDDGREPTPAPEAGAAPKPRNIGKELDEKRLALYRAKVEVTRTFRDKQYAEAKRRAQLRAKDEITGKRRSCEDVHADIVIERNDPESEVGKAWLAWEAARNRKLKLEADVPTWERYHWLEVNRGRFGA